MGDNVGESDCEGSEVASCGGLVGLRESLGAGLIVGLTGAADGDCTGDTEGAFVGLGATGEAGARVRDRETGDRV